MTGFDDEVCDDFVEDAHGFGEGGEVVAVGVEEAADYWGARGLVGVRQRERGRVGGVGERYVRLRS